VLSWNMNRGPFALPLVLQYSHIAVIGHKSLLSWVAVKCRLTGGFPWWCLQLDRVRVRSLVYFLISVQIELMQTAIQMLSSQCL
jgi:hypothetical protein